jgi:hypothetical protein
MISLVPNRLSQLTDPIGKLKWINKIKTEVGVHSQVEEGY